VGFSPPATPSPACRYHYVLPAWWTDDKTACTNVQVHSVNELWPAPCTVIKYWNHIRLQLWTVIYTLHSYLYTNQCFCAKHCTTTLQPNVTVHTVIKLQCDIGVDSMSVCLSITHWYWFKTNDHMITYSVSQKKTGPLLLIWHNFTNSQHLLIICGRERHYTILNSYAKILNPLRVRCVVSITPAVTWHTWTADFLTSNNVIFGRAINEWQNDCGPVSVLTNSIRTRHYSDKNTV